MQLYLVIALCAGFTSCSDDDEEENSVEISLANLQGTWDMIKCYGWEYDDNNQKENWTEDVSGEYIFFEDTDGNGGYSDGSHTYYFASSEQVPSSVGLGVLMNKDNTVRCAGGFIIQLMPFATEETISQLEENLKDVTSVTDFLDKGYTPEQMLEKLIGHLDLEITDTIPTQFLL